MRYLSLALLFTTAMILSMLSCQSCKDIPEPCDDPSNPECPNYDPCHTRRTPASAAFEVRMNHTPRVIAEDTVVAGAALTFVALDSTPGTTYEWQVGGPQNSSQTISYFLIFRCESVVGQTIPVRLITTRLIDSTCLNISELRDTFIRNIYFFPDRESFVFGRWQGALESAPHDVYTLEFGYENEFPTHPDTDPCNPWHYSYVKNIRNDGICIRRIYNALRFDYREVWFDQSHTVFASDGCPPPPGFIYTGLHESKVFAIGRDSIEVQFTYVSYKSSSNLVENLVFKGRRAP